MIKKLLVAPVLSLLFFNVAHAGTADIVNRLISETDKWSFEENKEKSWILNEQAQVIAEGVQNTTPVLLLRVLNQQVDLHIKSKQLEQAKKVCVQIFALKEKYPQLSGIPYADFLHKYATLLLLQGQLVEAEKASLQAIEYLGKVNATRIGSKLDEEFAFLGNIYMQQKEWDKAESYLRLAVFLNKVKETPAFGKDISYKENAVNDLIKVYQETKRDDLAKQVEAEMKPLLRSVAYISMVTRDPKYKDPVLLQDTCPSLPFPKETTPYAMEGTMRLAFLITADDKLVGKYVSHTSDWKRLDDVALGALAQCQFKAATYDGKPILNWLYYTYNWKVNTGGKPFPKPELVAGSCKSDSYDLVINDTKASENVISFKINTDGKPYDLDSELFKKNNALYSQLADVLRECRFAPAVVDGEARGNKATMRFVRKLS